MSFSRENSLWGPDSFQLKLFMWKRPENVCLTKSRAETFFWKDLPLGPLGVQLWWLHTIALLVSSYFGCLRMLTQQETNPPNSFCDILGPWIVSIKSLYVKTLRKWFFWPNQEPRPFWKDLRLGPLGMWLWWLHTIALLVSNYFGCLGMFTQQETSPPNVSDILGSWFVSITTLYVKMLKKWFFWPNQEPGPFWKDLRLGPLGMWLWWLHTIALSVSNYFGCLGMFTQQETSPPNVSDILGSWFVSITTLYVKMLKKWFFWPNQEPGPFGRIYVWGLWGCDYGGCTPLLC